MNEEKMAEIRKTDLKEKLKHQRFISWLLTVLVVVMFLTVIISKPEASTASKILPFVFLPMLITTFLKDKKIHKEVRSRQSE